MNLKFKVIVSLVLVFALVSCKNNVDKNRNSVGPGDYNIPSTIPDVPKYNYPDNSHRKIKF